MYYWFNNSFYELNDIGTGHFEKMSNDWLAHRCIWKVIFMLGWASIATMVIQYAVIGRHHVNVSTFRQDNWFNFGNNEFPRAIGIQKGGVYIAHRRYLESNSTRNSGFYRNRDHLLTVRDDVHLDWNEDGKGVLAVFVFSAISRNTSFGEYKNVLKVNAWEAMKHRKYVCKCCVLWKNNKISPAPARNRTHWKLAILAAAQYSCPIKGASRDVKGVTMEFSKRMCPRDASQYVKLALPLKQKQRSFAICAKIVYGNVDYKLLVDWVEYYRELKADKILMFVYKLNGTVLRVLQNYANSDFLEIRRFNFPWKTGYLARDVGVKNSKAWQDEQVVVFDCYERLRGYSYIAIVDLDEFIMPKQHSNLKDAMAMLTSRYPKSAGFTFKSYLFVKDWGKTAVNNGSDTVQYYHRTGAMYTRYKNVFLPQRVQDGSVCTHEFIPKPGYNRTIVPEKLAIIHHYRYCYSNYNHTCMNADRILDRSIDKIIKRIRPRTSKLLQRVHGSL